VNHKDTDMPCKAKQFISKKEGKVPYDIVPTLFVGLGGTGRDVLMRLRRRFFEQDGSLRSAWTRYLMMDTDSWRWWPAGAPEKEYSAVRPHPEEYVDCAISPHQSTPSSIAGATNGTRDS
jgi:hypothetical protein